MPTTPDESLGSIFGSNPRYLSNCSVRALVLPSPAGVQLLWASRPGQGAFASVRNAEKQKSSRALSMSLPRPAICLSYRAGVGISWEILLNLRVACAFKEWEMAERCSPLKKTYIFYTENSDYGITLWFLLWIKIFTGFLWNLFSGNLLTRFLHLFYTVF